jgi:hypothetical protein
MRTVVLAEILLDVQSAKKCKLSKRAVMLALLAGGIIPINGWADDCSKFTDGLIACYPFNGNANDYSGNENHGTPKGGVTLTADRFGNANSAYLFDGTDDYIQIKNSDTLNPKQITISAWYFATKSFQGNGNNVIIHKPYIGGHTPPYYQWHLGVSGDQYGNPDTFGFIGWVAIPTHFGVAVVLPTADLVGKWQHVVTSFDGTTLNVYVNGKLGNTLTLPSVTSIDSYSTDVFIGKHGDLNRPSDHTPGIIDDIRIYNRVLTEVESKQLYGVDSTVVGNYTASGQLLGKTGIPLGNVTIHIGEKTTTTDAAGNWSLNGLTAGKYDIVATKGKKSCVDSEFELFNNGQYQQWVNYACDVVTYGDETATVITIWQYVGTLPVKEFDEKYQEGRDYLFTQEQGDFLLQGFDDQGNTTSISAIKVR